MALTPAYAKMFADEFFLNYQATRKLRTTVMEIHGLIGDSYKSKVLDEVALNTIGLGGDDIPASPIVATAPEMTPADYALKLRISLQETKRINADVISRYVRSHTKAMGRREDQFVIDALESDTVKTVAVGTTNMTLTKFEAAMESLGNDEINSADNQMYIVMHQNQYTALLKDDNFTSGDFVVDRTLNLAGYRATFLGVRIVVLGNRALEGGLPKTGNNRTCFMYAQDAVELGYWIDPMVNITNEQENLRISTVSALTAGAMVSRPDGSVSIVCDETK